MKWFGFYYVILYLICENSSEGFHFSKQIQWRRNDWQFYQSTRSSSNTLPNVNDWRQRMIHSLKVNDFHLAKEIFLEIRNSSSQLEQNRSDLKFIYHLYSMFLSICTKQEHLPYVLEIIDFQTQYRFQKVEQTYFPLLRCYGDAGNVEAIYNLFQEMEKSKIEIKYRDVLPLLQVYARTQDVQGFFRAIHFMEQHNLFLRSSEFSLFLLTIGEYLTVTRSSKDQDLETTQAIFSTIHRILSNLTHQLSGLEVVDMLPLLRRFDPVTYQSFRTEWLASYRELQPNPSLPHAIDHDDVVNEPIYQCLLQHSEGEKLPSTASKDQFVTLVTIPPNSGVCTNCHSLLHQIPLSPIARQSLREEIFLKVSQKGNDAIQQLEQFESWLQSKHYDVILDGANIAYSNQNFQAGRFSYRQIDLVLEQLLPVGIKPLIILPACYCNASAKYIPNSIRRRTLLTKSEQRFIEALLQQEMLYPVPTKTNDDWYWILASISIRSDTNQSVPVITNDRMRDHRENFPDSTTFIQWRENYVLNYLMYRNWSFMDPVMRSFTTENDSFLHSDDIWISNQYDSMISVDEYSPVEEMRFGGNVSILYPPNFSRALQYSSDSHCWHLPVIDSSSLSTPNTSNSSSSGNSNPHLLSRLNQQWLCLRLSKEES